MRNIFQRELMGAGSLPAYIRALSKNRPRRKVGCLSSSPHFVTESACRSSAPLPAPGLLSVGLGDIPYKCIWTAMRSACHVRTNAMLAKAMPSGFGYPNPVLAETMPEYFPAVPVVSKCALSLPGIMQEWHLTLPIKRCKIDASTERSSKRWQVRIARA